MKSFTATIAFLAATFPLTAVMGAADIPATFHLTSHKIAVVPAGGWHVNEGYPWRARTTTGEVVPFKLKWNEAVAEPPPGDVTVIGGLCSAMTCITFKKNLTVPK